MPTLLIFWASANMQRTEECVVLLVGNCMKQSACVNILAFLTQCGYSNVVILYRKKIKKSRGRWPLFAKFVE